MYIHTVYVYTHCICVYTHCNIFLCSICDVFGLGVDASPLMTWGSIEGTPLRLDSDSTPAPGPSFKLPKVSSREQVALRLTDHVAKANRARKKASMGARYICVCANLNVFCCINGQYNAMCSYSVIGARGVCSYSLMRARGVCSYSLTHQKGVLVLTHDS